ncbi:CASP-like protein 4A1 [Gastrolobium bilobum]|uniref:CASP-like protein 4A1 n=1 Tax=Gastrolobium bilobum TaxID=150636 RepID=UPI002AB3149F|nr:CASP-like protein 4A1 [Gastrolobium bilobum]
MKKEKFEERATEPYRMKKDSKDKEEEEHEDSEQKSNEKKQNQYHTISEPSPSITFQSPSHRTRKSPSPPLHSLSDSPISDCHYSAGHGGSSPPPQEPQANSSPDSSISDDHFSVNYGVPPIENQRFSPAEAPPPVVMAHRFQVEPKVVTKVDPGAEEGFVGVKDVEQATDGYGNGGSGGGGGSNRRLRPDVSTLLRSKKVAMLSKLLLGLRIVAFVFCLISFSVLAVDKEKGWAEDSFYLYKEFRYSLSVNVIGFVYSGLQICDLVQYLITRKHLVEHKLKGYFSFALDQILTYLLMSASSSAATRAYDWESNWGVDKFPDMANASVALSFIAFVAFALASLVTGSIVCRFR